MKVQNESMLRLFLSFSAERHRVYERRVLGLPQEDWTSDSILQRYSFCNSFRVLDRGSQYFIQRLAAEPLDPETMLLRAAMYRMTNEPGFWDFYEETVGEMPKLDHFSNGKAAKGFREAAEAKMRIFRPAYRVFFGNNSDSQGRKKHEMAPEYFEKYFHPSGSESVSKEFWEAGNMREQFLALEKALRIGPFMAQQIVTDINYTPLFRGNENDTVVLGPGSFRGLSFIFGADEVPNNWHSPKGADLIRRLRDALTEVTIDLPGGGERSLSLMDVQNCLCEFGKYVNYAARFGKNTLGEATKKTRFKSHKTPPPVVLPAHWDDENLFT